MQRNYLILLASSILFLGSVLTLFKAVERSIANSYASHDKLLLYKLRAGHNKILGVLADQGYINML